MDRIPKSLLNFDVGAPTQDGELPIYSLKAGDKAAFKVDGPIKVEHRNTGAHLDGIHYFLVWEPLDDQGNVMPQMSNHPSGAPTVQKWVPPFSISDDEIYEPPFENRNGWRVLIRIPPQAPRAGNVPGVVLNIRDPSEE